jgi:hypothetical protein
MSFDAILICNVFKVGLDPRLQSIFLWPIGIKSKGVGIEMRGHIASTARVAVDIPRSGDSVAFFDNLKVSGPEFSNELDAETYTWHSSSDNEDVCLGHDGGYRSNGTGLNMW